MKSNKKSLACILVLCLCAWSFLGAKLFGDTRSELEYRVEQLEKDNAELKKKLEELTIKLELLQTRVEACGGSVSPAGQMKTTNAALPPQLEVVRLKPEDKAKSQDMHQPFTPRIKHHIGSSSEGIEPSHRKNGGSVSRYSTIKTKEGTPEAADRHVEIKTMRSADASGGGENNDGTPKPGKLVVVKEKELDSFQIENAPGTDQPEKAHGALVVEKQDPFADNTRAEEDASYKAYQEALKLFEDKQYKDADAKFAEFIKNNPGHAYSDLAYYWQGECHFQQQEYRQATKIFQKIAREFPHSTKAPDALYKAGLGRIYHGDLKEGIDTLEQVRLLYPYSDAARLAEEKIKEVSD